SRRGSACTSRRRRGRDPSAPPAWPSPARLRRSRERRQGARRQGSSSGDFQFLRPRPIGFGMRDTEVAVDAVGLRGGGLAVAIARRLALLLGVHLGKLVAVAAFLRVVAL